MRPVASPLALPVAADAIAPGPIAVFDDPDPGAPPVPIAPVRPAAGFRVAPPERLDVAGIGATIAGYMRGEGEAAAAHLRALSAARSPADLIRLQVREIQRAADASLSCWSQVARKASRVFAYR